MSFTDHLIFTSLTPGMVPESQSKVEKNTKGEPVSNARDNER